MDTECSLEDLHEALSTESLILTRAQNPTPSLSILVMYPILTNQMGFLLSKFSTQVGLYSM